MNRLQFRRSVLVWVRLQIRWCEGRSVGRLICPCVPGRKIWCLLIDCERKGCKLWIFTIARWWYDNAVQLRTQVVPTTAKYRPVVFVVGSCPEPYALPCPHADTSRTSASIPREQPPDTGLPSPTNVPASRWGNKRRCGTVRRSAWGNTSGGFTRISPRKRGNKCHQSTFFGFCSPVCSPASAWLSGDRSGRHHTVTH